MSDDYGLDWPSLVGNPTDLKYARRDLAALKAAADLARIVSVAVQAGANVGVFPLYLAQRFQFVHCYEPDPTTLDDLCENVPAYLYEGKIVKHDCALGERPGRAYLRYCRRDGRPGHPGTHHVDYSHRAGVPVNVETIDRLGLESCGLIYLDIEGFEFAALRGAEATLEKCRPVVGIELNKNLDFMGIAASDVRAWLAARRYKPALSILSDEIFVPEEWV